MTENLKYDAVVSIDLGWSPENITRTAAAFWRPGEGLWWTQPNPGIPNNILEIVEPFAGERTLVLLDIPIEGTGELSKSKPFRTIDRVLQHCSIFLYPSYHVGSHGRDLAAGIRQISDSLDVVESYPGAIHRFLWAAQAEPSCLEGKLRPVIDIDIWKREYPPNPKKGTVVERRGKLAEHISLISKYLPGDYTPLMPTASTNTRDLNALSDVCDAITALKVGIAMSLGCEWVFEARVPGEEGMIPIFADSNLRALWDSNVNKVLCG